ncbi:MAG TPA: hypothetical protein DEQ65_00005 [Ruminococcaceae bacterium]|nr:hypothetical protein [Oscillospiraceae bacterium]
MKKAYAFIAVILSVLLLSSCGKKNTASVITSSGGKADTSVSTDNIDFDFSNKDTEYDYDESEATVIKESEDAVKITAAGTYVITGRHSSITVSAPDSAKVRIILKNATVQNSSGPAIYITAADKVFITAYKGTVNTVSDGSAYSSDFDGTNVDGAVFSKADLTLNGEGTLNVTGSNKCAVVSKDDLIICGLTLNAKSLGSAIEGKDCVKSKDATVTVTSGGDGIKSTNSEDTARGFVYIESGLFNITAAKDGIQAETLVKLSGGEINVTSGGGAPEKVSSGGVGRAPFESSSSDDEESTNGIKAGTLILAEGGTITVSSADDTVHSNGDIQINGGKFALSSGDDGIHADNALIINSGEITVSKSYEGLEGKTVTVTGGNIDITSSDDGINAADGSSSSSGGAPGANASSDVYINISGGYITVNASGDGVDSNGNIDISGGVILVSGPASDGDSALDCDGTATVTGGTAIFCGSAGMAETFSDSSSQPSLMYTLDSAAAAGKSVALVNSEGKVIASFVPSKQYINIVISSPYLAVGSSYTLSVGGTVSGCDKNGYTDNGSISDAQSANEVKIISVSTTYGKSGGMGGNMGGMGGPQAGGNQAPPDNGGSQNVGKQQGGTPPERPGKTETQKS